MAVSEERTRALVLRVVDYGESDRIVTLLTERLGKGTAFARAARMSRRRFGAGLSAGALLEVALSRGRGGAAAATGAGGMWSLARAELLRAPDGLARDLGALARAHYALELCNLSIPDRQADAALFALCDAFVAKCTADGASEGALLRFELDLLRALGWAPAWVRCAECGRPWGGRTTAYFFPDHGGLLCPTHEAADRRGAVRLRARAAQAMAGEGDGPIDLADEDLRCARECLDFVWRVHLGRELKTVALRAQWSEA